MPLFPRACLSVLRFIFELETHSLRNGLDIRGLLTFAPAYFERVWGGHALRDKLGMPAPKQLRIGEAWLVSDHPVNDSRVASGPHEDRTLHALLEYDEPALLGRLPRRTRGGRFPLMLKLLDCTEVLSVQVHPDDALSRDMGEEDGGKTEMWYFLHADDGAEIICGISEGATESGFASAATRGELGEWLQRWPVSAGDSALVRAGTVHALGGGLLAAEIQQTSDVTYRLHDWNRMDQHGQGRELHIDKGLRCINWDNPFAGVATPLVRTHEHGRREVLAACEFFAAERVEADGFAHAWETGGRSFRLLLGIEGMVEVQAGGDEAVLRPGDCLMVCGAEPGYITQGTGVFLDYYVPDLDHDIMEPLLQAGHTEKTIRALMGLGDN